MFAFIHQWFAGSTPDLDGLSGQEVERAIETAVDLTDARLRLLGGYQRKLRPAVVEALLHVRELVHQIPGVVEISRSSYAHDPMVYNLFGSVKQLEQVFCNSAEAQEFNSKSWRSDGEHLYGLLLMSLNQKTRPGFVLKGDMVQGDVMQNIVYFSDHNLVKVAASEDEVRTMLRERAFEAMLREFGLRVSEQKIRTSELKREQVRLRRDSNQAAKVKLEELERDLAALEASLAHVDDYLGLLVEVLTNPDEHCGLEHRELQLDRSGVQLDADSDEGHRVPYAEITVGELVRVGMLVRYPLDELTEVDHLQELYRVTI